MAASGCSWDSAGLSGRLSFNLPSTFTGSVPYAGYFAGFVSAGFEPRKYPANTPQKNPARVTYSAKTDVSAMRSARRWLPRHFMFDKAAFRYKKAISNIKCLGNQPLAERMTISPFLRGSSGTKFQNIHFAG